MQGAGARVGCAKAETPTPSWALKPEGLEAIHLLFSDLLEDVGAAASVFPSESAELGHRMPDPRAWTLQLETPAQRQDRVLGVLKAAEARGRVRALRLRYARLRVRQGRGDHPAGGSEGEAGPPVAKAPQHPRALTPAPAGGGDLAPNPAPEVRARRPPAGAVPAAAAEAHADPRPPRPSRGDCEPGKGRGGAGARPPPRTPGPSTSSPAAEARGNHSGGESRRQHLPALMATPQCTTVPHPPT